jgi:hypothetical protein
MSNKPGRCAVNRITIIVVIFAALTLSGCVVLPIPTPADSPPYSPEQIAKIRESYSSREEVASVMGSESDIRRLDGRYWIYHWRVESGMWFAVPLLPPVNGGMPMGNMGPIASKQFILFLEFDEKGILLSKQFGDETANKYCTARGLCLEHKIDVGRATYGGRLSREFRNMTCAFTVRGSGKDFLPWPMAGDERCVVVLWPDDEDWKDPEGLWLAIGDPPEGPRVWLPAGSYRTLSLPAGQQTVSAPNPRNEFNPLQDAYAKFDMIDKFQCKAGQTVYIEIGKILTNNRVSIVLRTIDPETGPRVIADMPRLLPPEKEGRKFQK